MTYKFEIGLTYEFTYADGRCIRGEFLGGLANDGYHIFRCDDGTTRTTKELIEVKGFINVTKID